MSHYIETTVTPIFKSPRGRPDRWTMAALRQHLQTALLLELYTIPPYLFAMYSIDTDKVPGNEKEEEVKAVQAFRHIVGQEMLHLALVGNLITAVRGRPQLYGEPYVPKYPSEILYEGVLLTLAPASQEQIQNFVELEQPSDEKEPSNGLPEVTSVLEGYKSIGDFYNNLKEGLKELHGREEIGDAMFDKTSIDKQWKKGDFFEDVAVIDNLETALDKLTLIIEQGEGGSVGSQNIPGESHYEVFQRLVEKKLSVHKLVHDPKTARFEGKEKLYPVMLACDAAYSYLLWSIEMVWVYGGPDGEGTKRGGLKGNVRQLMFSVLRPLATFLVKQGLNSLKKKNAAPPFNLYIFEEGTSPKAEFAALIDTAMAAVKDYPGAPDFEKLKAAVQKLIDLGDL